VNATPESRAPGSSPSRPAALLLLPATLLLAAAPVVVQAGPVVCTTTLEAPQANGAAVTVSRCGPVETVPELVQRRFYTHTAPFEDRVTIGHQLTDLLGISPPGRGGQRRIGFGFPDQTIVYDGVALQNTAAQLLEAQSSPLPLRTPDLNSCFATSLIGSPCGSERR
jgi:hypothetical protein